jgi:hypothetical protein
MARHCAANCNFHLARAVPQPFHYYFVTLFQHDAQITKKGRHVLADPDDYILSNFASEGSETRQASSLK